MPTLSSRTSWAICLIVIIAAGLLSRLIHTGWPVFDKYLGDALYAAMVYAILRLFSHSHAVPLWAMALMTVVEVFQLTMIPAHMVRSGNLAVKIVGRLLGTEFSFWDLLAYAIGIVCLCAMDSRARR